jgi:transposase
VRIINPKKVKGFVQGHKTDANDALATANASLQIGLKTSKPKSEEQKTLKILETSPLFLSRSITALSNHLRAMLLNVAFVSSVGVKGLTNDVLETFDEASLLPKCLRSTVNQLWITYLNLKIELAQLIKTKNSLVCQL